MKTNALFVVKDGIYFNDPAIEPWDFSRNAFNCENGAPAIAHPPCDRWGRYWSGGPSVKIRKKLGDDKGCFAFALWYVRTHGGVIEHPEASHAWNFFGLSRPPKKGGWIKADEYGGFTCCVEQGHYGHKARKATWLYINKCPPVDLVWGKAEGKISIEESFRDSQERHVARSAGIGPVPRISSSERLGTPQAFKELLLKIVSGVQ